MPLLTVLCDDDSNGSGARPSIAPDHAATDVASGNTDPELGRVTFDVLALRAADERLVA